MALGHRILVPLDGSPFAERALPFVEMIAAHADGELHLVSVHLPRIAADLYPETYGAVADLDRTGEDALKTYLEHVSSELIAHGRAVRTTVLAGRPDDALLEYGAGQRCDLVVMATHGRGGFDRVWHGSVADRVARRAEVPVLLIPAALTEAGPGDDDAASPIRTVIIPSDGSVLSERVLPHATALGEAFGAEYVLFRAAVPFDYVPLPPFTEHSAVLAAELQERDRAETRRAMHELAARMREAGLTTTVMIEEEDDPVRALLRLAETTPGTVIAMATHGRGGLRRALLGSVTDKVARAAGRPVLVVRPSHETSHRAGLKRDGAPAASAAHARAAVLVEDGRRT